MAVWKEKDLFEEFIQTFGFTKLDESELKMMEELFSISALYIFGTNKKKRILVKGDPYLDLGIYNQNYLLLKHILKLEEQNEQLLNQNHQIIELLTGIKDK